MSVCSAVGRTEAWPRWLPAPTLRDLEAHFVTTSGGVGACGATVMWVESGHPTSRRRRCAVCRDVAASAGEGG
jgi:hypothetical protein